VLAVSVARAAPLRTGRRSRSKLCLWASDRPLRGRPESLIRRDRRVAGAARARAGRAGGSVTLLPARPVTVQPSVPPVSRAPWQDTVRAAGPRRGR
jgi:hypothetical protein